MDGLTFGILRYVNSVIVHQLDMMPMMSQWAISEYPSRLRRVFAQSLLCEYHLFFFLLEIKANYRNRNWTRFERETKGNPEMPSWFRLH